MWQPVWLFYFSMVVITEVYKGWTDLGLMLCGLTVSVPLIFIPIFFPFQHEASLPWYERYSVKANLYIGIVNFVGNYFWTHYFYVCLGASYSFPATIMLNRVPFFLYLITQSYFSLYYITANLLLRRVKRACAGQERNVTLAAIALTTILLSWFFAFMETWTIESVPYYSFISRDAMYKIGLTFYAIYFIPTFPMFLRVDEEEGENWSLWRVAVDALAGCMIVFILCDFWRLGMSDVMEELVHGINATRTPFVYKS